MAYNANNQLISWGTSNLFYDQNGNMTSDGTHSYTWDARNRLAKIDNGTTGTFTYDPFERRASKNVLGTSTNFLFDGLNSIQEVISGTNTANSLTGGVDEVFQRTDSAGARIYLTDALGSLLALADSTGTVQTSYTFEPFDSTTTSGTASTNTFAYTGRELDAGNLNLYFYRARYYNPTLGRFISEDPIEFAGGDANLYAYVFDSPTNFLDPLGLDGWTRASGGLRAAGGIFETAAGVGLAVTKGWTGLGAVGGALVAAHGVDQIQAGLSQLFLGCRVDSFTSQGLQAAGLSPAAANTVDAGLGAVGSLGAGARVFRPVAFVFSRGAVSSEPS